MSIFQRLSLQPAIAFAPLIAWQGQRRPGRARTATERPIRP
jgi:hypothetical protein